MQGRRPESKYRMQHIAAGLWVLTSLVFLDSAYSKVQDLRAAGAPVSRLRYGNVVFWIGMLLFWIYRAWFCWRRYRMDEKVV